MRAMKTETIEALGEAGNKTTIAGAGLTGWGWLTSNEFLGVAGLLVAIGGVVVAWYYKRKADRRHAAYIAARDLREAQESSLRMALMRASGRPIEPDTDMGAVDALEADE